MNDMEITYRNDDTGETRAVRNVNIVPYGMLNGEIRQANGTFWKFKNGKIIASNTTPTA